MVSLQLLDPSAWRMAADGGVLREENVIVLEARSIMYSLLPVKRSATHVFFFFSDEDENPGLS